MNEPASFNTNELKPHNWLYPEDDESHPYFTLKCPPNRWDDPPYRTSSFKKLCSCLSFSRSNVMCRIFFVSENCFAYDDDSGKQRLSSKTICMTAEHRMGDKTYLHYNVHSLYGHTNAIVTFK